MTTDLHDRLDDASRNAPPVTFGLPDLERRKERNAARRRRGALVLGLAITVALGGTLLTTARTTSTDPARPVAGGDLNLDGRLWYRREALFYGTADGAPGPRSCVLRFEGERWIGADWSARTRGALLSPVDTRGSADRPCIPGPISYGPGADGEFEDATFGPGGFPHEDPPMDGLPSDPEELRAVLLARSAPGGSSPVPAVTPGPGQAAATGTMVRIVNEGIFEAPPALQLGYYWFARTIPGMHADDHATDPTGRPAIALRISTEGMDRTWYFDPEHHQVLAYVATWPVQGNAIEAGALYEMRLALAGGLVDGMGARPDADQRLVPEATRDPVIGGVTFPVLSDAR